MRHARLFALGIALSLPLALEACSSSEDTDESGGPSPDTIAAWEDAYEQTEFGKADSSGCSGVVVPDKGNFGKHVALTFDDGPNPATTPTVLDILKKYGIKATFFINGMRVNSDAARAVLSRILGEGHILANHSQHHLNLKTVSQSKLESEVMQTHEAILAAGATPRYMRFPFGSASCAGIAFVKGQGYAVTGWHLDSADWCFAAGSGHCSASTFKYVPNQYRDDLVGYSVSQAKAKNGGILLFHDIHPNTVAHLEQIIQQIQAAGLSFTNLDDTGVFPLLNGQAATPTPFIGDPCKSDADCNFSDGGKSGYCHLFTPAGGSEVGFCSLGCEGYCPDQGGKAPTFCTSLDGGATGSCVSKADALNGDCTKIPGTSAQTADRFIGSSGASPSTVPACMPD